MIFFHVLRDFFLILTKIKTLNEDLYKGHPTQDQET